MIKEEVGIQILDEQQKKTKKTGFSKTHPINIELFLSFIYIVYITDVYINSIKINKAIPILNLILTQVHLEYLPAHAECKIVAAHLIEGHGSGENPL